MIRPVAFCLDEKVAITACQKGCAIPQKKFAVNSYSPLAYIIDSDKVLYRTFSQIGIAPSYVSKINMFNLTNSKFHRKELVLDHHPEVHVKLDSVSDVKFIILQKSQKKAVHLQWSPAYA